MRPLLVLEDTVRPRWRLWTALGVEWWATRWVWVSPLFWVALGGAVAWGEGGGGWPARGVGYGVLLYLTNTAHTLGHIVAGSWAGSRMDAVVLTSTRDVNVYRGPKREVAEWVRVVRSLGGPLANAALGLASLGLAALAAPAPSASGWLRMFAVFNACIAAWTLMPVPTMDGWVVWLWLFGWRDRHDRPIS